MTEFLPRASAPAVDGNGRFTRETYDALRRAFKSLSDKDATILEQQQAILALLNALGAEDVEGLQELGPLLESKQDASAVLDAIAGILGTGVVVRDGSAFTTRQIAPVAGETTVTNGTGTSGNPTVGLANLADSGTGTLLAITRDAKGRASGTKAATITGTAGRVTVANGDAAAGLPTVDLATVADGGGGSLLRIVRDEWGRITGTSAPTTTDLAEGTNLYHTADRARTAAVADTITDGVTNIAPSQNAVFDALSGKTTHADMFADHVVSGLLSPTSANLTSTLAAGVAYVTGLRVVKAAEEFTYAANSDTYEDMNASGVITRSVVANGGAVPAVTANTLRLQKVVTNASAVTAVTQLAQTSALIVQTITDGDTTHAPSGDAVFDALALKTTNSAAAITGGTINGASVGATTAGSGRFTTLTTTDSATAANLAGGAFTNAANGFALFSGDPDNYNISRSSTQVRIKSGGSISLIAGGVAVVNANADYFSTPQLFLCGGTSDDGSGARLQVAGAIRASTWLRVGSYTVAGLPAVGAAGTMIYVSDEVGGGVPAFSDGTNWRRVTDRAIVS